MQGAVENRSLFVLRGDILKQLLDKLFVLHTCPQLDWPVWKKVIYYGWRTAGLLCGGLLLGYQLLGLAYGQYTWEIFVGYKSSPELLALNILPVVWLLFLFYGITGRAWLGYLLGGVSALLLSMGHFYKLSFRDDPLLFEDLFIIREAGAMAADLEYNLFLDRRLIVSLLCLAAGVVILLLLARGAVKGWKKRLGMVLATVLAGALLWGTYMDTGRYNAVENYDHLNRWSPTQNYIAHGFFYPFLHSVTDFIQTPPEGYSDREAETILSRYEDVDIPEERKVNVIAIMREAYVDFSLYGIDGLDTSGYEAYHQLQAESYSGRLLTNIFAGGTIDSERCFLTGNYMLKNFRSSANSYLWYLRDQGYTVEGSHPYYQWFYNRQNVNGYLGFERYRFLEGDYEKLTHAYLPEDSILYPEVYADFQANKATGKPYFSFVLNVQSHGPYSTTSYGGEKEYLTGDYSAACKNAMNNYMAAIMEGDRELMKLVEQLRCDREPVVMVLYSDHLPWMGDGSVYYQEMGLDLDTGTEQGFRNYYTTDYLIWANDAAKEVLGSDFTGEGPTVSPCYLMNLAFAQCGWTGPAYMQAMSDMMEVFPVVTTHGCYVIDGQFTDTVPAQRKELFDQFQYINYYWRSKFIY